MAKYKSPSRTVWFEGHGSFQYYMEKLGGLPIDVEGSLLQPDDTVVAPEIGAYTMLPERSVGWVEQVQYALSSWMNLMGSTDTEAAGFYGANFGPVPFAIGKPPVQVYYVVKVFSQVQFNTQPANPREVQAGGLPSFPHNSALVKNKSVFPMNSEAMTQIQVASQSEADGRVEEAIQQYRQILEVDSNNALALDHLAGILATTRKPELRDGKEAVQLATKAVELTDRRLPQFIGTLAAALAQAGQFPQACETAKTAYDLARLMGQKDIADTNARLYERYSSGKTADAAPGP